MYSVDHALTSTRIYPEREEKRTGRLDQAGVALWGIASRLVDRGWLRFEWITRRANEEASEMKAISEGDICLVARNLGQRLRREGFTEELVGRAFALVREVAERKLGIRHFDVQLVGGLVLLKGMVAEMETGEGKTLTATLAASTAALAGIPVHIVTVNDYLATRDREWMGPVYEALGLTVGTIMHGLEPHARREAYGCDITYCTNKEVAFDYLRDRIVLWDRPGETRLQLERLYGGDSRINRLLMRGLRFAIVDEADSVLVDEARTPLIISAEARDFTEQAVYSEAFEVAGELTADDDFRVLVSGHNVELTALGKFRIEKFPWRESRGWTTERQREEVVRQALVGLNLYVRDKQYLVRDGKVEIVDEYTGRAMPDRSWEQGLHQLIEIKEACALTTRKETRARISYQRFFRRYVRLAGMTGTAREVAGELWSVYGLRVVSIPTNRPLNRSHMKDRFYSTAAEKWQGVVETVRDVQGTGRPVLIGTRSVATSEHLSGLLWEAGLPHRVLNARQDQEEAEIVAKAGQTGCVTVATNMAGRGTDIRLAPEVAGLGGLHVIATERHEARRIDRQLFGRSARQGDPGTCEAFVSLEDELMTVHANPFLRRLAALVAKSKGGPGMEWLMKFLFRQGQIAAERAHHRMRRNLLKMDEQLGDALAFSGRQE